MTSPEEGIFLLNGSGETLRFVSETEALEAARARAIEHARALAARSGLAEPHVELTEEADAAEIEGKRKLVEARVRAVASGRPRVAD